MCIYWLRRSGGRRLCSFTYCPFLDPFTTRLALPKTPQVQMSSLFDRYIPKAEASRFVRSDQLFTIDHVNHGCISASITQIALLFVLNRLPLTSSFSSPSSSLISSPPSPPLLFLLLFLLPFPPSLSSAVVTFHLLVLTEEIQFHKLLAGQLLQCTRLEQAEAMKFEGCVSQFFSTLRFSR